MFQDTTESCDASSGSSSGEKRRRKKTAATITPPCTRKLVTMSTAIEPNGHAVELGDEVVRPRPRKPQHSQVSQVSRMSSNDGDGMLTLPVENGTASEMTR